MVKIVNPLGDVKIGRQGEVVYQRKYGEQIRRQASPKRAIASQAQLAHRQLYRAALTWRSNLSLANRRYLDGYCIANGIVDDYHIPLPWSRFALKLYLQKVAFALITKPIPGVEGGWILQENYTEGMDGHVNIYASYWAAQSFTPLVSHTLKRIAVLLGRSNNIGGSTLIGIKATDGSGHPTGDWLTYISQPNSALPIGSFQEFIYDLTPIQVSQGTKYALEVQFQGGSGAWCIWWKADLTAATYPRGCREHAYGGTPAWGSIPDDDFYFKEWGYIDPIAPVLGLLHARHPALLKIVHKRGELTVNGYDTLSSLDEEYLTGQVGLDVEAGDSIKATTLPGIEYAYLVR